MKRFLLITLVALAVPTTALAKGASEATIEGPGLDEAIIVRGDGESLESPLGRLSELSGFFPAVFERTPNPMLATRPGISLGPRYSVSWVMPYGDRSSVVHQDLYPFARPFPVSYTKPGQAFFDGMKTHGGWYQGTPELKQALAEIGLPASPPAPGDDDGLRPWQITLLVVGAAALVVALVVMIRRFGRQRPQPA
jgi:hypothetical protein